MSATRLSKTDFEACVATEGTYLHMVKGSHVRKQKEGSISTVRILSLLFRQNGTLCNDLTFEQIVTLLDRHSGTAIPIEKIRESVQEIFVRKEDDAIKSIVALGMIEQRWLNLSRKFREGLRLIQKVKDLRIPGLSFDEAPMVGQKINFAVNIHYDFSGIRSSKAFSIYAKFRHLADTALITKKVNLSTLEVELQQLLSIAHHADRSDGDLALVALRIAGLFLFLITSERTKGISIEINDLAIENLNVMLDQKTETYRWLCAPALGDHSDEIKRIFPEQLFTMDDYLHNVGLLGAFTNILNKRADTRQDRILLNGTMIKRFNLLTTPIDDEFQPNMETRKHLKIIQRTLPRAIRYAADMDEEERPETPPRMAISPAAAGGAGGGYRSPELEEPLEVARPNNPKTMSLQEALTPYRLKTQRPVFFHKRVMNWQEPSELNWESCIKMVPLELLGNLVNTHYPSYREVREDGRTFLQIPAEMQLPGKSGLEKNRGFFEICIGRGGIIYHALFQKEDDLMGALTSKANPFAEKDFPELGAEGAPTPLKVGKKKKDKRGASVTMDFTGALIVDQKLPEGRTIPGGITIFPPAMQ